MPVLFQLANFQLAKLMKRFSRHYATNKASFQLRLGTTWLTTNEGDGQVIARQARAEMVIGLSNISSLATQKLS
jgi:hypothetical protein